ncbi:MAG: ATP-binding cassette domain-containing protein [Desulfobacterales bacterium]|nr:ATP-binding cassette domain-containing protein [Desulfobacterales bacterium]
MENYLIKLNKITARLYDKFILKDSTWNLKKNESWVILGPNGSGKSSFVRTLTGKVPVVKGSIEYSLNPKSDIAIVSFEDLKILLQKEDFLEECRNYSNSNSQTTALSLLQINEDTTNLNKYINVFQLNNLLNKNILELSTGERRKFLIVKALLKSPDVLILDEPFEGLDKNSKASLKEIIDNLIDRNIQIMLVTHRFDEIPDKIENILYIDSLKIKDNGNKKDILNRYFNKKIFHKKTVKKNISYGSSLKLRSLVEMRNINIKYGDHVVLANLTWTMKSDENWKISGPNGSGKSTLLKLISADNLQAYSNEIYLFGRKRGTGESIFDIKKRIGLVTPELQLQYRKKITVLNVVISGFFDSIGLYQQPSEIQINRAVDVLKTTGLDIKKRFDHLSYGEQRVVLISRAIVKSPEILILDEPCQGLDPDNRNIVLNLCDQIAFNTDTRILFVSHNEDDNLKCISNELKLNSNSNNDYEIAKL